VGWVTLDNAIAIHDIILVLMSLTHSLRRYCIAIRQREAEALCGTGWIGRRLVLCVKPQTYMNASGQRRDIFGAALRAPRERI